MTDTINTINPTDKEAESPVEISPEKRAVMKELLKAGSHYGHKKSKWNPQMAPYVFGVRNGIHIIDLEQTVDKLEEAVNFLSDAVKENKIIVFISTKIQSRHLIKEAAEALNMPYVIERWIGGTLTNFGIIFGRIKQLKDLEEKQKSGQLDKYTKYEQQTFAKKIGDMNKKFGGLKNLTKLPDVIFLLELDKNEAVVREANQLNIPIVAIVDTNTNPALVIRPIPANDDSVPALTFIMQKIKEALLKAKSVSAKMKEEKNE